MSEVAHMIPGPSLTVVGLTSIFCDTTLTYTPGLGSPLPKLPYQAENRTSRTVYNWKRAFAHAVVGLSLAPKMAILRGFIYYWVLTSVATASAVFADHIHGCDGFIEASPALIKLRKATDAKLDYSHIAVELQTPDGLVKDRTHCAPNGYYFIPVYDKGSFLIRVKGPEGWSWDPDKVLVTVDHSGCNANEDINFQLTGFTLSGRVVGAIGGKSCLRRNGGPANVSIELFSPIGIVVSSVLTSTDGIYVLKDITPGKFKLRASHLDFNIEARGSTEVDVVFGNFIVDDIFFVSGYNIRGFVVAQGNPILGVKVYLRSEDITAVECPKGFGSPPGGRKSLCHAVSNADGMFEFNSVPCGSYELEPYYSGGNTVFDISPPFMSLSVDHHHVTLLQKFQVTGFSIGGRVVDGYGMGVEGVIIIVDGNERFITDSQGYYKLDQVTSNRYTIEAKKKHYRFGSLMDVLVLPNASSIPYIKASHYDICGIINIFTSGYKGKVALTHGPENVKPQIVQTNAHEKFCIAVLEGEYRLSALPVLSERSPGLLFLPPYIDVVVKSPILNIEFSQALFKIKGAVVCKKSCSQSVSVKLSELGGINVERTSGLTHQSTEFLFSYVLPGKYRLEVKHISSSDIPSEDNWCWEHNQIDVAVGTEDVNGIVFVQKGYMVEVVSTHDLYAYMSHADGSSANVTLKKGIQQLCVELPGVHKLHFIDSCVSFGSSSVKIDTENLSPIHLMGEKYLLRGKIIVELNSLGTMYDLPEIILVDVLDDSHTIGERIGKFQLDETDQTHTVIYEYRLWARPGERLFFFPHDSRTSDVRKLLFYPAKNYASVTSGGCADLVPPFYARKGLYIEGSVSPPISGVHIRVISEEDSSISGLMSGMLAFEASTDTDGLFVAGPLYDDIRYSIEASKLGYHLKQIAPFSFSVQKLGQISVHLYLKDKTEDYFPPVLLSLSGDDGYRNNSVSGVGGTFTFTNLFPGSFYLRPLLKEYAFERPVQAVELGSGEYLEVSFQAVRVAYSISGVVTLLSGYPIEGVRIEARSGADGYYEEALTDSMGNYRLRGLIPDTSYLIQVAKGSNKGDAKIERASPESAAVQTGLEDVKGLNFVVFEQPGTTILSCHMEGLAEDYHSFIRVEIRSVDDQSNVERVFPLPLSNFFQVKDLPRGKHLVQLQSTHPPGTYAFECDIIEADFSKHDQVHVGPLRYRISKMRGKQDVTPAPVYPLLLGVSVIALFIIMPRLKDLLQESMFASVSSSNLLGRKEPRKSSSKRKAS